MSLTLANKITIGRILAVPFFIVVVLYYSGGDSLLRYLALAVFLLAVVSDVIDGYVARVRREKTRAGTILDPLADKILLISAFICLYKVGVNFPIARFPVWLVVTVISRDVILLIGGMLIYILHKHMPLEATVWGKASTFFQVACVVDMLVQYPWAGSPWLWIVTVIFAVVSVLDYIRQGIKVINIT